MRVRSAIAAAAVLAVLAGSGSAAQRASPRAEAPVPFKVGETLTYDVTWSTFLVAGSAVTTVRDKAAAGGSTAYTVVAEGKPVALLARLYTLFYKMETTLDAGSLLPQRVSLYMEEGKRRRTGVTRFDRAAKRAFFELQAEPTVSTSFAISAQTMDGLSLIYSLRARTLKTGDALTLTVADEGTLYDVRVAVRPVEQVSVPLGAFPAWKLNVDIVDSAGEPAAKNAAIWISNDPRRLPLKLQAELPVGDFVLALRDVH
jgi:hypothetical protein